MYVYFCIHTQTIISILKYEYIKSYMNIKYSYFQNGDLFGSNIEFSPNL